MTHLWKRSLSCLLVLVLTLQMATPALAYLQETGKSEREEIVLVDGEGNETPVDESWDEVYPYGAFAFDTAAVDAAEGDDTVVTVYRLGGTRGRATAYITYAPLVISEEDGSPYYGYALDGSDLTLEVEEPLPIAQYQPVGKYADPEPGSAVVNAVSDPEGYVLSISEPAEHYLWQVRYQGIWCDVGDSDSSTLPLDTEYLSGGYDYRCVYTVDGVRYCTFTLGGEEYVKPEPEELEPMPEDILLNPEPTYCALDLTDEDGPYSGWIFAMTFAEGEWKKELHFHANTDELTEEMEAATLRIAYTDGGEIAKSSDSLFYHVTDMNESTPSTVGFTVQRVDADQASGSVELLVRREGGNERPVSVNFRTEDGTAKAGRDYAAAEGTLMFYGNVCELPVTVQLIDNGQKSDEPRDFAVLLSEVKGDDKCTLTADAAVVSLTNSGTGDGSNLASRLYDAEAVDMSAAVADSPTAANAGSEPVVGEQTEVEEVEWIPLDLIPVDDAGLSTQAYSLVSNSPESSFTIDFSALAQRGKWESKAELAKYEYFDSPSNSSVKLYGPGTVSDVGNKVDGILGTYDNVRFEQYTVKSGVALAGNFVGHVAMSSSICERIGQMYSGYEASLECVYSHDKSEFLGTGGHGYDGTNYGCSILVPTLAIAQDSWAIAGSESEEYKAREYLYEPRDIRVEKDSKGSFVGYFRTWGYSNWNAQGKSSNQGVSAFDNPYSNSYSGSFGDFTGTIGIALDMPFGYFNGYRTDRMLHNTLINLKTLKLTRRTFRSGAFSVDITTPNDKYYIDPQTGAVEYVKDGSHMIISDYECYKPVVTVSNNGGVAGGNQLYVGSTISFARNQNLPPCMSIRSVEVMSSTDGKTWEPFNKFTSTRDGEKFTIELVGDKGKELTINEIRNTYFKFRVVYERTNKVTVNLKPSLPRSADGTVLEDQASVKQMFTGYTGQTGDGWDHCFGSARITYGYSTLNQIYDYDIAYSTYPEAGKGTQGNDYIQPTLPADSNVNVSTTWSLNAAGIHNIQWINFGLSPQDILLLNGQSYRGNETIYFTPEDLAGDINFTYYHQKFQESVNSMTTTISWMGLYLDKNRDNKINGHYEAGTFVLDPDKDELVRYLRDGESVNELEIAPVEVEQGEYAQQYMLICYTMTPRCLKEPEANDPRRNDRAQIMPAVTTAINPTAPAYSTLTSEQRMYNYVISGVDASGKHTSDDHLMYGKSANAKSVLIVPLGGDQSPPVLDEHNEYQWTPNWCTNNLFAYDAPTPVEITESLAGKKTVPGDVSVKLSDNLLDPPTYKYTANGLKQLNGYLASMVGTSTLVLVTTEQKETTAQLRASGNSSLISPDSTTMSNVKTSPDAAYLRQIKGSGEGDSSTTMLTGGSESQMPEFSMPFDINFGSNEIGITDYVTLLMDENRIGFSVGVPLFGYEKGGSRNGWHGGSWNDGEGKNQPYAANKDAWGALTDFMTAAKNKNKNLGDKTLEDSRTSNTTKGVQSGKFSVGFSFATAFIFEYNHLANKYYFSAWEAGFALELSFRLQARLTACPVFYAFFDVSFSLDIKTGLGVTHDSVDDTAIIDATTAAKKDTAKVITYYPVDPPKLDQAKYNALSSDEKAKYTALTYQGATMYVKTEEFLARKEFYLSNQQYQTLSDAEKENYATEDHATYYNKNNCVNTKDAFAKFSAASAYTFPITTRAFTIRFDGKLFVQVQEMKNGEWAVSEDGFTGGTISSDGLADTQVVLKHEEEQTGNSNPNMNEDEKRAESFKLNKDKQYRVVLYALDSKEEELLDKTTIYYLAQIKDIAKSVHWNGITISPELSIEIGVGVGVEVLRAELYLHIGLGAEFLIGGYNPNYDPLKPELKQPEYLHQVNSFELTIGLAARVVLVFFTYEMEFISYQISYSNNGPVTNSGELFSSGNWEYEVHYLNDLVGNDADGEDFGITIRLPVCKADVQKVYSPEDNEDGELSTQAYNPTDRSVPFQTSGYGSSMDAANLTSNIPEGSRFKAVQVETEDGEHNPVTRSFLVYTLSRADVSPVDSPMLVMSELGYNDSKYGLLNPADPANTAQKYIVLDDDGTGDLDFDVWVDGNTVRAAWVSYASASPMPGKPDGDAYSGMNADNYKTVAAPARGSQNYTAYQAWYEYYLYLDSPNAWAQAKAAEAAKNTVVKTASWTVGAESFGVPALLNRNSDYSYVFQPASAGGGSAVFFASTAAADENGAALTAYKNYLDGKYTAAQNMGGITNYLTGMKKSSLDLFGTGSALNLAVNDNGSWVIFQKTISPGQTIANVEFASAGTDSYYLAYTTEQTEYAGGDMATVYRLYLRKATVGTKTEGTGEQTVTKPDVTWSDPYLIRELRDFDQNKNGSKDGVYSGGSLMAGKEYASPYLANLKFLTANLDADILTGSEELSMETQAVQEQTLLCFEMNGATYIIPENKLQSITSGNAGLIYPFFVPPIHTNMDGSKVQEGSSGKIGVDINADANGNLYAVYIGAAEGTTGNALYLSAYDAEINAWGDGVMLAMHNMDTYEASVREKWDNNTTELAYLYGDSGISANETAIKALYGEDALSSVKAVKAREDAIENKPADYQSDLGDARTFTFTDVQTVKGAGDNELLAITQGTLRSMYIRSYTDDGKTRYILSPTYQNGVVDSEQGTYVVSFSQGGSALGKGSIVFTPQDFGKGSSMYVSLSAENVGTSAFRGSSSQPITATLTAGDQEIARWTIRENIVSGQTISLRGACAELENDLREGDSFTLTVSEFTGSSGGQEYVGTTKSITLFTVEKKPDLSVEDFTIEPVAMTGNGSGTVLSVDFVAANQGSADAEGVYAQFTYISGYNGDEPVYSPLPLTNSSLTVGGQTSLDDLLTTQEIDKTLENGVLDLYSDDGTGTGTSSSDIKKGCGKRVSGTIELPSSAFAAGESKYAEIRVELFSTTSAMTTMEVGAYTAVHDEYYGTNNIATRKLEAYTDFSIAHAIVIPLGTTTRIPVSAISSRGAKPVIYLEEIDDADGKNIGILNFKQSSADSGCVSGVLSLSPVSAGTGVIHVTDTDTNTTFSVAFEVTDAADGIDIYKDNKSFTFYNREGEPYTDDGANKKWSFPGTDSWGDRETNSLEEPLRRNLAVGDKGAIFTFDSVATGIDLYFRGEVAVTSTNPNFATANGGKASVIVRNDTGGSIPADTIRLGENDGNEIYTITVTVRSDAAFFDRLEETYAGNVVPVPSYDGVSPAFIWSRSFPDTASAASGSIPLKLYILDNSSVASLIVEGKQFTDPSADGDALTSDNAKVWCYDFGSLTQNGNYTVTATDDSGNQTSTTLIVDWFHPSPSGDANTLDVPMYTADFRQNGQAVTGSISTAEGLCIQFSEDAGNRKSADNTHEVYAFDGSAFRKVIGTGETPFPVTANGIFWTRTVNADNTWSAQILNMDRIDSSVPMVTLTFDEENTALNWTASKSASSSKINAVSINGYPVYSGEPTRGSSLSGVLPIRYSGSYELTATDASVPANTTAVAFNAVVPLQGLADDDVMIGSVWNQAENNGSVRVDLENLFGGYYNAAKSNLTRNEYGGAAYETALLAEGQTIDGLTDEDWVTLDNTDNRVRKWENLVPGTYTIVIRDSLDHTNVLTRSVTVKSIVLRASATTLNASRPSTKDGKIVVITTGGTTSLAEFAVLPAAQVREDAPLESFKGVTWTLGDENRTFTATELAGGSYYVAARSTCADAIEMLNQKAGALESARIALETANAALEADPEDAALQGAAADAQADFDAAEEAYQTARKNVPAETTMFYSADEGLWDGVYVFAVSVKANPLPTSPSSSGGDHTHRGDSAGNAIADVSADKNGSVAFELKPGVKMSAEDQAKLREANANADIVIRSGGFTAMIPQGTLKDPNFDLNRVVVNVSNAREGMVMAYTDAEGNERINIFGVVGDGTVSCIILAEGDYRCVEADVEFGDIAGLWGEEYIRFVAERGLLKGTGGGDFSPNVTMSRAMFITVLWRMSGSPDPAAEATFKDLAADWYKDAVAWAVEEGITSGYNRTAFGSDDPVTREQMCVLMVRYLEYLGWDLDKLMPAADFADADEISSWAEDSVELCTQFGLINGVGGNKVAPGKDASRMETSAILTRFVEAIVKQYCGG